MRGRSRRGIVIRRLLILLGVLAAIGLAVLGALYGHKLRVRQLALQARTDAEAAWTRGDAAAAVDGYQQYLDRFPNDVAVLPKFAAAHLAIRPLRDANVRQAIVANRRLLTVSARREAPPEAIEAAYTLLARLYEQTSNFSELEFIATQRLSEEPGDLAAKLWLGRAQTVQRETESATKTLNELLAALEAAGRQSSPEYVEACTLLAAIAASERGETARENAITWLERALSANPQALAALVQRAVLRRDFSRNAVATTREEMLAQSRADLEAASNSPDVDPTLRVFLVDEWIAAGEPARAQTELDRLMQTAPDAIARAFVDPDDWTLATSLRAIRLALLANNTPRGVELSAAALAALTKDRQRSAILPFAIRAFAAAGDASQARVALDEYVEKTRLSELPPQRSDELATLRGLVAMIEGNAYEAIEQLEPLAARGDAPPAVRRMLADAYIRIGQTERALPLLGDYVAAQPTDLAGQMALARLQVRRGEFDAALAVARAALAVRPDDVDARLVAVQAQLGAAKRAPDAAALDALQTELDALAQTAPQRADVRLAAVELALLRGNRADARALLEAAAAVTESSLDARLRLASLALEEKDESAAEAASRAACEQHPTDPRAWYSLARVYDEFKRPADAIQALEDGAGRVSDPVAQQRLRREKALVELRSGDRASGLAGLRALATANPKDVVVRDALLSLPEVLQDAAESSRVLAEVRAAEGETGLFWRVHEARIALAQPNWRERRRDIETLLVYCVSAMPGWSDAVVMLGELYERLGELDSAEVIYRKACEATPPPLPVADRLAALLERQGRAAEALAVVERLNFRAAPAEWEDRAVALAVRAGAYSSAIERLRLRVGGGQRDPRDMVTIARLEYLQTKDAAAALTTLDEAAALAPDSTDVLAARLSILRAAGRVDDAKTALNEFVTRVNSFDALLLRAAFLQSLGESEQSAEELRMLTQQTRTAYDFAVLGEFHARAGRMAEALAVWDAGLKAEPDDVRLRRGIIKGLIVRNGEGDRARATELLKPLLAAETNDAELHYIDAVLAGFGESPADAQQARAALERAVSIAPGYVDAYVLLVPRLVQAGEAQKAVEVSREALQRVPNEPRLLVSSAMAEMAAGRSDGAADAARLALRAQPENAQALEMLVELALRAGRVEELRTLADRISRAADAPGAGERMRVAAGLLAAPRSLDDPAVVRLTPPELVRAAVTLAQAGGDADRAGALFERALTADPGLAPAHLGAAMLRYARGDAPGAIAGYRRVLELDPKNLEAINNLAWTLAEQPGAARESLDEALTLATRAVELTQGDANARDTRAFVLEKLERWPDARDEYRAALDRAADDRQRAPLFVGLARVCSMLSDADGLRSALTEARRIQRLQPDALTPAQREELERLGSEARHQ